MRYLVLSDIHANLEAFETCRALAQGKYDEILCLGDLVGYNASPAECLAVLKRRPLEPAFARTKNNRRCTRPRQ